MKTNRTNVCLAFMVVLFSLIAEFSSAQLKADFNCDIQSGCSPLIISFTDNSTENPTSWKWDLGNGSYSTLQNPVATYSASGVYTIKLFVQKGSTVDSIIKTSYIIVYANPQVQFSAGSAEGCFPLTVNFSNNSKASSGTISNYLWDFGDGNTSTDATAKHVYTSSGTFDVTLKITNNYGCINTLTKNDFVHIDDGANAGFSITSLDVCRLPATALFKNLSSGSAGTTYLWNFGDGSASTDISPSHIYNSSGTYNVLLTAKSGKGCKDTASLPVKIAVPSSSFKNTQTACSNQSVSFANTSEPAPVSNTWYFDDGTISREFNPYKTYGNSGTFKVKLVNIFSAGCSDSVTKTITIASGPSASFKADKTTSCTTPLIVNFTNTTTGSAQHFLWNFGDGQTSEEVNPKHIYTTADSFTVTLTAINSNGCQNVFEAKNLIHILPVKIINITNLPDSGCIPFKVEPKVLLNLNAKIKSYNWSFGDGSKSAAELPSYTYTKEGIYTIKVTIKTEDGCTASYTYNNAVYAGHKPHADFMPSSDTTCSNFTIKFFNTSTNGPITFLHWNYDNPIQDSVTGHSFLFTPDDTGRYHIRLIAYNYGCADTIKKDRFYALPPTARLNYKIDCTNKNIVFADSSLLDIEHTWNFGDGTSDTAKNPVHSYPSSGTYAVSLYTANKACRDTAKATVHVISGEGKISVANKSFCRGGEVSAEITGVNAEDIKETIWDFGDGNTATVSAGLKAVHTYLPAGKFKLTAVTTDANGCRHFYALPDSVNVFGPQANFFNLKPVACENDKIIFADKSQSDGTHNIVKWKWDYGNETIKEYSSSQPFSNVYHNTGRFNVSLLVTDSYGCSDSANNNIIVTHPVASFSFSDSIVCFGKQLSFTNTSYGESDMQFIWNFDDGVQSNEKSPLYTYKKSGSFIPSLKVTDANGCSDSISSKPVMISNPIARFNMNDSFSTCPPLQVNFSNVSGGYNSVDWSFGDGSNSVLASPVHFYTYPGTYPVKLISKGYGSCLDSITKKISIKGPTGKLMYNSTPLCSPGTVNFSASVSPVISYTWDFSDGNAGITTINNAKHTYDTGFFVPTLILTDSSGCKVPVVGRDTIKVFDVKANANVSAYKVCESAPLEFSDKSESRDIMTKHTWYFGDNDSSAAARVNHYYQVPGTYRASLIAVTKNGCTDTLNIAPVTILPSPHVNIISDTIACARAVLNFKYINNTTDKPLVKWNWAFNNGFSAFGQEVNTTYTAGGNYTVTLIATNQAGCSDTALQKIKINALPNVNAGIDTVVCQNTVYRLNALGAQDYIWQGAGLSCSNCQSPDVKADSSATYILTGTDAAGCKANDSITVKSIMHTSLKVSGDDSLCMGEKKQFAASGEYGYKWIPSTYLDNDQSANPVFTAVKDTSLTYSVIGYSQKHCFSDTGFVHVKSFPVPQLKIQSSELVLSSGSSAKLVSTGSSDINQWQWQPKTGLDNANVSNPVASPRQTTTYSCIASNGGGCVARDEVTVKVICKNTNTFIPNTFSPDGDGVNDIFFARGSGLFTIKSFRIFNRWGQLIFEKYNVQPNSASEGWDGTYNKKQLQPDVYVYMMELVCDNGFIIPTKGDITLLK